MASTLTPKYYFPKEAEINVPSINNDIFLDSTKTDKGKVMSCKYRLNIIKIVNKCFLDTQHGCLTDCVTVSNDADMLGMRKIVDSKTRRKRDTRRFIRSPQSGMYSNANPMFSFFNILLGN